MRIDKRFIVGTLTALLSVTCAYGDGGSNPRLSPPTPPPYSAGELAPQQEGIVLRKVDTGLSPDNSESNSSSSLEVSALLDFDSFSFRPDQLLASSGSTFSGSLNSIMFSVFGVNTTEILDYFGSDGKAVIDDNDFLYYTEWDATTAISGLPRETFFIGNFPWIYSSNHFWLYADGKGADNVNAVEDRVDDFWLFDQVFQKHWFTTREDWEEGWFNIKRYDDGPSEWFWYGRKVDGLRRWYDENDVELTEPAIVADVDVTQFPTASYGGYVERISVTVTREFNGQSVPLEDIAVKFGVNEGSVAIHGEQLRSADGSTVSVITGNTGVASAYIYYPSEAEVAGGAGTAKIGISIAEYHGEEGNYYRSEVLEVETNHLGTNPNPTNTLTVTGNSRSERLLSNEISSLFGLALYDPSGETVEGATIRLTLLSTDAQYVDFFDQDSLPLASGQTVDITTDNSGRAYFRVKPKHEETVPFVVEARQYDTQAGAFVGQAMYFDLRELSPFYKARLLMSNDRQSTVSGDFSEKPYIAQLLDETGRALSGFPIRFEIFSGSGLLNDEPSGTGTSFIDVITNANGRAEAWLKPTGANGEAIWGTASIPDSNDLLHVPFLGQTLDTASPVIKNELHVQRGYGFSVPQNDFVSLLVNVTGPGSKSHIGQRIRFSVRDSEKGKLFVNQSDTGVDVLEIILFPDSSASAQLELLGAPGEACWIDVELLDASLNVVATSEIYTFSANDSETESGSLLNNLGGTQWTLANQILIEPLQVRLVDELRDGIAGVPVNFSIDAGNGLFYTDNRGRNLHNANTPVYTSDSGVASIYFAPSNVPGGSVRVSAVAQPAGQDPSNTVYYTANIIDPRDSVLQDDDQLGVNTVLIGQPSRNKLEVQALRYDGGAISKLPVTFEILQGANAGLLSSDPNVTGEQSNTITVQTGVDGKAAVFLDPLNEPGSYLTVTAKAIQGEIESDLLTFELKIVSFGGGSNFEEEFDGLPDSWERDMFGDLSEGIYGDPDEDGLTNLQEYLLGLDPLDTAGSAVGDEHYDPDSDDFPDGILSTLESSVSVTPSGGMAISVPLPIIPGINGMEPSLGLQYDSQGGNGIVGMGWSLSGLSSITRGPKREHLDGYISTVNFTGDDAFYLDGQRLIRVSGTNGEVGAVYRTEIDSQQLITIKSEGGGLPYFEVETKSGLIMEYGSVGAARFDHGSVNRVSGYMLNKVIDRFDNYYAIEYARPNVTNPITGDPSQDRPMVSKITYTGYPGTIGKNEILFDYTIRPDAYFGYAHGYTSHNRFRLNKIEVAREGTLWRTYEMRYIQSAATDRSMLKGIVTRAGEATNQTYLMPTAFNWNQEPDLSDRSWMPGLGGTNFGDWGPDNVAERWFTGDFNQDGRADLVSIGNAGNNTWAMNLYYADDNTFIHQDVNSSTFAGKPGVVDSKLLDFPFPTNNDTVNFFQGDFKQDGRPDFMKMTPDDGDSLRFAIFYNEGAIGSTSAAWSCEADLPVYDASGNNLLTPGSAGYPTYRRYRPYLEADFNGDGITDILSIDDIDPGVPGTGTKFDLFLVQDDMSIVYQSWMTDSGAEFLQNGDELDKYQRWRLGDYNGDGMMDVMRMAYKDGDALFDVFLNQPDGTQGARKFKRYTQPLNHPFYPDSNAEGALNQRLHPADVNGDGMMDLVLIEGEIIFYIMSKGFNQNNPNQLFEKVPVDISLLTKTDGYNGPLPSGGTLKESEWRLGDFFGDGYIDLVHVKPSAVLEGAVDKVVVGTTGYGNRAKNLYELFGKTKQCVIYNLLPPSLDDGFRIETIVVDLAAAEESLGLTEIIEGSTKKPKYPAMYPFVADFSGNGKADLFLNTPDNGGITYGVKRFHLWSSQSEVPDTIHTVINGLGVRTEVDYAPLTNVMDTVYTLRTDAGTRVGAGYFDVISASNVVSEVRRDVGLGSAENPVQTTHNYTYEGMAVSLDRGSAGFSKMTVTDTYGDELTTTTTTTYEQAFPFTGAVNTTITEVAAGTGNSQSPFLPKVKVGETIVDRVHDRVARNPYAGLPIIQPIELKMTKLNYELDGSLISRSVTSKAEADVDICGNVLKITDTIGFGVDDEFTTVTTNTYGTSDTDKRFGRLSESTVTKTRPLIQHNGNYQQYQTSTRTSAFTYDPTTLVLKSETIEPDATGDDAYLKQRTDYIYDTRGNITSTVVIADDDGNKARSAFNTYTDDHRFVATSKIGFTDQITTFTNDTLSGAVLTVEDANGIKTVNTYDRFDRLMRVDTLQAGGDNTGPAPAQTRRMRASDSSLDAPYGAISVVKTWVTPNEAAPQYVFYDRLGREMRSASKTGKGDWLYSDTFYTVRGLVDRTTRPYVAGADSGGDWNDILDYAYARYDALGRIVIQTAPGGGVNGFVYDGRVTKQYQLLDNSAGEMFNNVPGLNLDAGTLFGARARVDYSMVTVVTDAAGQTIFVRDNEDLIHDTGLWHYYDADGNLVLTYVPKPNGNGVGVSNEFILAAHMTYDRRGNKIHMNDPNMGEWHYKYNGFGELKEQRDAAGNRVEFDYDFQGRATERRDAHSDDGGTTWTNTGTTTWVYDSAVNGIGLLASTTTGAGYTQSFEYDSYSRIKKTHETIDSETFTFEYTYDVHGRPNSMIYPNGVTTLNNYSDNGLLGKIFRTDVATDGPLWETQDYDDIGGISQFKLGNGLITRLDRDERRGFINRIYTGTSAENSGIQNLDFGYKLVGHLSWRTDYNRHLQEAMVYDGRQRLLNVTLKSGLGQPNQTVHPTQNCNYDVLGNLLGKSRNDGSQIWMDYNYEEAGRPNAVQAQGTYIDGDIERPLDEHYFAYNANGSLTEKRVQDATGQLLQSYTWTTFNKPLTMENHVSDAHATFYYGADRQRVRQYMDKGAFNGLREVKYIGGGLFEKEIDDADGINNAAQGAVITERAYISTPAGNVAVIVTEDDGTTVTEKTDYMHHDHQGSLAEVTNELGAVVASYSYDAWGALRDPTDWQGDPQANQGVEELSLYHNRSYTGHEPLEEFDLVHMNGRVYDPDLGRFVSADPFVQFPDDRQGFNRYTYVLNNPLSYSDPSGYFIQFLAAAVFLAVAADTQDPILGAITGVIGGAFLNAGLTGVIGRGWAAAVSGATVGGVNDGLKGALIGGGTALAFFGVGSAFGQVAAGEVGGELTTGQFATKIVAHGVVGGTSAVISGGEFHHGFLSAGVTQAFSGPIGDILPDSEYVGSAARVAAAATLGGTVSELTGGSFANGAITAGFSRLFNDEMHRKRGVRRGRHRATSKEQQINRLRGQTRIAGIKSRFWRSANMAANSSVAHGIEGAGMGFMAGIDGAIDIVPLVDFKPLEMAGFYDSSKYGLEASQLVGSLTRDVALVFGGAAGWRSIASGGGGGLSVQSSLTLSGAGFMPLGTTYAVGTSSSNAALTLNLTKTFITTQASRASTVQDAYNYYNDE